MQWDSEDTTDLFRPAVTPGLTELLVAAGAGPPPAERGARYDLWERLQVAAGERLSSAMDEIAGGPQATIGSEAVGALVRQFGMKGRSGRMTSTLAEGLIVANASPELASQRLRQDPGVAAMIASGNEAFPKTHYPDLGGHTFLTDQGAPKVSPQSPGLAINIRSDSAKRVLFPERVSEDRPDIAPDVSEKELLDRAAASEQIQVVEDEEVAARSFWSIVGHGIELFVGSRLYRIVTGGNGAVRASGPSAPSPVKLHTRSPSAYVECFPYGYFNLTGLGWMDAKGRSAPFTLKSNQWVFVRTSSTPAVREKTGHRVPTVRADNVIETKSF